MESNIRNNELILKDSKQVLYVVDKSVNSLVIGWKLFNKNSSDKHGKEFYILQMYDDEHKCWKTKYW